MTENTALVEVVSTLPEQKAKNVIGQFEPIFNAAKALEDSIKGLVNLSDDEITPEVASLARAYRLKLLKVRTSSDKLHKELKEQALREGRAIDGIRNIIKAIIVPQEERLEQIENYEKIQAEKKRQALLEEREGKLGAYIDNVTLYDLANMSEEGFEKLLSLSRQAYNDRIAAEKKVEAERIAKEKAEAEERKRLAIENEKLKEELARKQAEAERERLEREKAEAVEREKQRLEQEAREKELEAERAKQRQIQEEAEKKLEIERQVAAEKLRIEQEERQRLIDEANRRPLKVFVDGDKFCVLFGTDVQAGVSGFGSTVEQAITAFAKNWLEAKIKK